MGETILVIDDDAELLEFVRDRLESEGFKVEASEDAMSGLTRAAMTPPDLVLLDVSDPAGFEVLRSLKGGASTANVPVVLLTVAASVEELVKGLDAGADDYVTKPFVVEELFVWVFLVL